MNSGNVIFKGTVNGLTIIMKDEIEFKEILAEIDEKIHSAGRFFKGAILNVKYKGKKLDSTERDEIFKLLVLRSGAEIKSFQEDAEDTQTNVEDTKSNTLVTNRFNYFDGIEKGITKFHRGTIRSGQKIVFDGNLTVLGDVNPGGELVASGNVIVMGSLRGIVHAGADGNKEAIIAAINLQPSVLKIADVITRSPDDHNNKDNIVPEVAYIKDDIVYIDDIT